MNRTCKTCGTVFEINKWQKQKEYCNDACKPTFRPNRGKPRGRPKNEWKEVFEKYNIQTPLGTTGSYSTIFNLSQYPKGDKMNIFFFRQITREISRDVM